MKFIISLKGTNSQNLKYKSPKSKILASCVLIFVSLFTLAQKQDSLKTNQLNEVLVKPTRLGAQSPFAFSNLSKTEIAKINLGQDIPILMNFLPSVVTTSDTGNGFGYTGLRIRGSDATRVNVTMNGIPFNDSESQGTFFVDLPDFASSLQSVQLQRGAGTSTNGAGAFGASLNLQTDNFSEKSAGEINNSIGSFNSRKHTVKFSTGLMNNRFEIAGRLSNLYSDGYIDRAFSKLKGYFLQGNYVNKNTLIKAITFGGTQQTYQAYYGIDAVTMQTNRQTNASGQYTDLAGNTRFYDNEIDDYKQDHYQLHWNQKINNNLSTNLAVHYTKGLGFYENYKQNADYKDYNMLPTASSTSTDLIRQKWLDNDFYGTTFSVNYQQKKVDFVFGGSANNYLGKHYGKVIWARNSSNLDIGDKYYNNSAQKTDVTLFAKVSYNLTNKILIFGDLQIRNVSYTANFDDNNLVNKQFNFINPKAGITYLINRNSNIYLSYAKANKEPNRTDFENATEFAPPQPESLDDFELGYRLSNDKTQLNINGFYMKYDNQLVLTGQLDDVGNPIRKNVGKSYRIGIEIDANIKFAKKWNIRPNITISENKNIDFIEASSSNTINRGDTNIAYSPKIIAGNILIFNPIKKWQFNLLSKFVSEQFLSNLDNHDSKLNDYFVQDCQIIFDLQPNKIFKTATFNFLANNVLNKMYVSNGADYGGGYVVYFPQAGSNFMFGVNLGF